MSPVASFAEWSSKWESGLLFIFDSNLTVALLLFTEVGQSRTLLWTQRGGESEHFVSTLGDEQVQIRMWTCSPRPSVLELERWSRSRKDPVLTTISTTVTFATLLPSGLVVLSLVHSSYLGISLPSLCLSPGLDLLFPMSHVFFFLDYSF